MRIGQNNAVKIFEVKSRNFKKMEIFFFEKMIDFYYKVYYNENERKVGCSKCQI